MRTLVLISILLISAITNAQHVVYGEKHPQDSPNSIYFDKDGMLYPNCLISDSTLLKDEGSLKEWYIFNQTVTDSLLDRFNIPRDHSGTVTFYGNQLLALNDSLIKEKAQFYDSVSKNRGLEFYIHGFRKSYLENGTDVTSVTEFGLLTSALLNNGKREHVVVRVYWDGMYDCCFSTNRDKNNELFRLFETASTNASSVSASFAKFLGYLEQERVNVVAHSLGSKVAIQSILESKNNRSKFNISLIAPAIPGSLIQAYYEKNTPLPNCRWLIVYNEKDFVLKKKDNKVGLFGPGAYQYGITSLGCNKKNDALNLLKWMKKQHSDVSFSLVNKSSIGKLHSLRNYTKNQNLMEVSNFLEGN